MDHIAKPPSLKALQADSYIVHFVAELARLADDNGNQDLANGLRKCCVESTKAIWRQAALHGLKLHADPST